MVPIIHFKCRSCEGDVPVRPERTVLVRCPHCNDEAEVFINDSLVEHRIVTVCVSCGHDTFYVQKDFNRKVGLGIVGVGIAASIYFFAQGQPLYAMGSLGLTAFIDFFLHSIVRDVTVCYACHAVYRGFNRNPDHEAFDLKKLEKYGGRTPRGKP